VFSVYRNQSEPDASERGSVNPCAILDPYGLPKILCAITESVFAAVCLVAFGIADNDLRVSILVYHRFGPEVADSMTVTTPVFDSHLKYLQENNYTVIPLRELIRYHVHQLSHLPTRSVVITVDDGHRSVYTYLFPLVKRYRVPVTLFIYPSAISNAAYAMTWEQLREMEDSGFFEIQSHTYWHPNFHREKKSLTSKQYGEFVDWQLTQARASLERKLGIQVDMMAWPFGIYDNELIQKAVAAGYVAALTLERRHASRSDSLMALPRYLMTDRDKGVAFARLLSGRSAQQ
jgi:peptidoglycan/xylan/chitin deacetylase (PgdA/CDA1 family)